MFYAIKRRSFVLLEREVVAGGARLEVALHGTPVPGKAPIVLLHEGLGSVALWKSFPLQLAERTGRYVVVYSRYGHGSSGVLASKRDVDYMHQEGAAVLPQVIAELGLEHPILFGHSDGASIALICAGTHPDLASALVLEAPHVFVEEHTIAGIEAARTDFLTTNLPEKLARYHRDVERTFWGWNDIWLDERFRSWNIERYLPAVHVPVLVIQGEDDEYGTAAQYEAIAAHIPTAQIVTLAGCGHSPHRDRTLATLDATASFLAANLSNA